MLLFLNIFEINLVVITVRHPEIKAKLVVTKSDISKSMAMQAPTLAPEETPNKSGDTNLLLKMLWYIVPESAKAIPISVESNVLGILRYRIIRSDIGFIF